MVRLADALVEVSDRTGAGRVAGGADALVSAAKPDFVLLRHEPAPDFGPTHDGAAPPAPPAARAGERVASPRAPLLARRDRPLRILLIGASSIQLHLGAELQRALRSSYRDVTVKRFGKLATGLVRTDFFDWPAKATELIEEFSPDVVVAQFGGNDAQRISVRGQTPLSFGTAEWDEELDRRVAAFVDIAQSRGAKFIMLGMPMMREPGFSKRMQHVNEVMKRGTERTGGVFISTWDLSADPHGKYTNSAVVDGAAHLLRQTDGIHLTRAGAIFMARRVSEHLERELTLVPADDARSVVVRHEIDSKALGRKVPYLAYVPQREARDGGALPVMFLLHGSGGRFTDWSEHAQRQLEELSSKHRLVIVTPDGGEDGWYVDSPLVPNSRYETHIAEEVVADVEAYLPVSARRGIGGISMGGNGAIALAMKHPDVFAIASSMSGAVDLSTIPTRAALVDRLGPYEQNRARWDESSAHQLVADHPEVARKIPLLVTVGSDDKWAPANRAFAAKLSALGVPHIFEEHEGGHDWRTWTKHLPRHVAWHAERLAALP